MSEASAREAAPAPDESMIRLSGVGKTYDDGTVAVHELDLEVARGELVVLVGPSGCGKSTTLKMINRLIEPTTGAHLHRRPGRHHRRRRQAAQGNRLRHPGISLFPTPEDPAHGDPRRWPLDAESTSPPKSAPAS